MVFMGTEKYPDENEWAAFLSSHGGEDNGETDAETTCFYFDVHPNYLREGMDRFCQFFAAPRFAWGSSEREVKAIESEFQQAKTSDSNREAQVHAALIDEAHPYNTFGWGDRRSLVERPAAARVDMQREMRQFHAQHYSAGRMSAVEPLDELQLWALESCGAIPNKQTSRPRFSSGPPPFAPHRLPLEVRVKPLKDVRRLDFSWFVPSLQEHHRCRPAEYVAHLLGHEGAGSCLAALKAAGLATDLSAGLQEDTSAAAEFAVSVDLTPRGAGELDSVVAAVLAFLGFLVRAGPQAWVQEELRGLAALRFKFAESEPEVDYCRRIALSMARPFYPPEPDAVLSGDHLLSAWRPELVEELLSRLTPSSLLLTVVIAERGAAGDGGDAAGPGGEWQVEPWFDTQFRVSPPLSAERRSLWDEAYAGAGGGPGDAPWAALFALPKPNPYIPTDLSLLCPPPAGGADPSSKPSPPSLLESTQSGCVFCLPDSRFFAPKGVVALEIGTPGASASIERRLLGELAAKVCAELLNEESYSASLGGLGLEIFATPRGWALQVDGFSHKMAQLGVRACETLASLATRGDDAEVGEAFSRVLQQYELGLSNACFKVGDRAPYERRRVLEASFFHYDDMLRAVRGLTPQQLAGFVADTLGGGAYISTYLGGNVDAAVALSFSKAMHAALGSPPPLQQSDVHANTVTLLADEGSCWLVWAVGAKNPTDSNSAVETYWQLGPSEHGLSARLTLLEHLMFEPLFDALRTKQQLGYTVHCCARNTLQMLGFTVTVVSATHLPLEIEGRIGEFLASFLDSLAAMPATEFAKNVEAAVANRLQRDRNLAEEAARYFPEIEARTFVFDRAEREAELMRATSQSELVEWARRALVGDEARRLSVHVHKGGADPAGEALPDGALRFELETEKAKLSTWTQPDEPLPPLAM